MYIRMKYIYIYIYWERKSNREGQLSSKEVMGSVGYPDGAAGHKQKNAYASAVYGLAASGEVAHAA